jgi:hypothetical protein
MQQLENQQPRLAALQVQMNQLQHSTTPDEARVLNQKSKELEQKTNVMISCTFFVLIKLDLVS